MCFKSLVTVLTTGSAGLFGGVAYADFTGQTAWNRKRYVNNIDPNNLGAEIVFRSVHREMCGRVGASIGMLIGVIIVL